MDRCARRVAAVNRSITKKRIRRLLFYSFTNPFGGTFRAELRIILAMTDVATLPPSEIDRIFGPLAQARTYRHLAYFALAFPLGIVYFVLMITGLSVGAGLAILVVGFLILALTLALGRVFGRLERWLTSSLLGATFQPLKARAPGIRAALTEGRDWRRVFYLLLRFPIGVAGFVASIMFVAAVLMIAAPVLYQMVPYVIGTERIATSEEALLVSLFGFVLLLIWTHAINGMASLTRWMAEALL